MLLNLAHYYGLAYYMYSTASFAFTSTFSWKFFITGRFVQRLKLRNLAHLYGLAKYMHSTVLLLSPQHFPESSFTALFLISWIGPTSSIFHFQQNYYFFFITKYSFSCFYFNNFLKGQQNYDVFITKYSFSCFYFNNFRYLAEEAVMCFEAKNIV